MRSDFESVKSRKILFSENFSFFLDVLAGFMLSSNC